MDRTMKFAVAVCSAALFLTSLSVRAENRISDLPLLSSLLVHHFDCEASVFNKSQAPGSQNGKFSFVPDPRPGKQPRGGTEVVLGADVLSVSANAQMLQLKWARNHSMVSSVVTMIRNSPTHAYVLITYDPMDEDNLANLSCVAVTFADQKAQK